MNRFVSKGFTLVEMMVIAPIVILLIGAFIAAIVGLTGEVMSSRGSNVVAYDLQDALNRIEEDVKLSTSYLATNSIKFSATPTPDNPQGYGANGSYSDFTNAGGANGTALILNTLVTDGNPLSLTTSSLYLANKPNDCGDPILYSKNTPMTANVIYYVYNSTLWRRVVMPKNYDVTTEWCGSKAPWQQPSCQPGYSAAFCKTNDIRLIDGVAASDFIVQYFSSASSTAASVPAVTGADLTARTTAMQSTPTVSVSIIARKSIAGREIERAGTLRATRLDTNASAIAKDTTPTAVPGVPNISNTVSDGHNVTFTWPRVATATSYSLDYRINGGTWVSGGTNIDNNSRSYTVTDGTHTDTVEVRVRATNVVGNSTYGTSTVTIPLWAPLILKGGWTEYVGHASVSYTKTKAGVVMFKGLVKNGSGSITQLPEEYRPSGSLIFETSSNQAASRVDVRADGNIYMSAGNNAWLALDGIHYTASTITQTNFTNLSNGWTNYDTANWAPSSYAVDSVGRVHTRGLVGGGATGGGTVIVSLPAALQPSEYSHLVNQNADTHRHISITQTGQLVAKGGSSAWLSLNGLIYPSATRTTGANCTTNWCNLTLLNGWLYYGSPYTTPQYTKSSDGIVMVKGLIRAGNTGLAIANLPAGFCPKERILMTVVGADLWARVDVLPNIPAGTGCQIIPVGVNATWTTLDTVVFMAEE